MAPEASLIKVQMAAQIKVIAAAFEYVSHVLVVERNESTSRKENPGLVVTILAGNTKRRFWTLLAGDKKIQEHMMSKLQGMLSHCGNLLNIHSNTVMKQNNLGNKR